MTQHSSALLPVMEQAVAACVSHVKAGGLPFVGVLVSDQGVLSEFGVNRVQETGDRTAHAEIVAMRDAMTTHGLTTLTGAVLLATGEPCGLCYRYAIDHGIQQIYVAVDRDEAAAFGFDYRASYPALGITDTQRADLLHPLPVARGAEPFFHYLQIHTGRRAQPSHTSAAATQTAHFAGP